MVLGIYKLILSNLWLKIGRIDGTEQFTRFDLFNACSQTYASVAEVTVNAKCGFYNRECHGNATVNLKGSRI